MITGVSGPTGSAGTGSDQPADERTALVHRISASPQFRRAAKLREFLTYVVEQTLNGQGDSLNEQQIGQAVFGRGADYSPAEDNVVRAHARQLRVKLAEYFADSGKAEPLLVEIPKGSYVPIFSPRPSAPPLPAAPVHKHWTAHLSSRTAFWTTGAALAVLLLASVALLIQNVALKQQVATYVSATGGPIPAPLAWVFDPDRTVSVVVADSCFGLMQDLVGRPASLEEYLDPEFWQSARPPARGSEGERLMRRVRSRELTSYADVLLAARILRLAGPRARISIRFARDLHPRDLESGNFIFLGSAYANPWVALFDRRRNFQIQVNSPTTQVAVINKAPQRGEQKTYQMLGEDGVPGPTYGLVAFHPSDGTSGNVLVIEGTNMEGTEAAGSMILDPKSARSVLAQVGIPEGNHSHPFFEVLFETTALAGAPSHTRVIGGRK